MRSAEGSVFKSIDGRRWIARLRYTDSTGVYREKKRVCLTHKAALTKIRELQDEIAIQKADRKTYRHLDSFFRDEYVHPAKYVSGQKISGYRQKIVGLNKYLDSAREYF